MIKKLYKKWFNCYRGIYRIKYFPKTFYKFCKELRFYLKNGYPYDATYEHFNWFIETEKKILKDFLDNHCGYPEYGDIKSNEDWEKLINYLIVLLLEMDENNYPKKGISPEETEAMIAAKNEFFELFSSHFYDFWD